MAGTLMVAGLLAFVPRQESFETLARAALAQIDGTVQLRGLRDSVRVLRDAWGVPHIYANNIDDLFFAQGYVQAQDRLWQMDLYHRTYTGRLSEILGPSAMRHDRLMRLLQYRGPFDDREWKSYHPEGKRIFDAFSAGVNAYIAQGRLPVEFTLTGLKPLPWTAEVALLRTQTAMPVADLRSELRLARDVAEHGAVEANRRARPDPYRDLHVPAATNVNAIDEAVLASLDGMMTVTIRLPLLPEYQRWADAMPRENEGAQENSPGSNNWVVSGTRTASGHVILANDPHRNVSNPSIRYIVHLNAPGWDLIGATEAPLPGVAIGHNGRIAWGLTIVGTDQADVYVEQLNPANRNQVRWQNGWENLRIVHDTIRVKDASPQITELKYSRHGPIFHVDTVRNLAYAMRSTMHEPGSAGYLGAMRYHALDNCRAFLDTQVYFKAPTENMICGDVHGNIAWQASALSPKRAGWDGRLPVSGTGQFEWQGFRDDLPREFNPERGWIATANHNIHPPNYDPPLFFKSGDTGARYRRLAELLSARSDFTVASFERMQHDAYSAAAARDVELFRGWTAANSEVERARSMIANWDAVYDRNSTAAALFSYASRTLAPARADSLTPAARQRIVERALTAALDTARARQGSDPAQWRWGRIHRSEFPHMLTRAYDIPAVERSGGPGTVAATGATFREVIDLGNLDASTATNTPGQSGQPFSPFYANLAQSSADQRYFPLLYSRNRVEAAAKHSLTLTPMAVHRQAVNGPLIQLSMARETPAPGFRYVKLSSGDGGFYVAERPIVSDDQIEAVHVSVKPDGLVLDVRLIPSAANDLQRFVRADIGGRMAVLIASELVSAPAIVDPRAISSDRLQIGVELPRAKAEEVASAIAVRWPESDTIRREPFAAEEFIRDLLTGRSCLFAKQGYDAQVRSDTFDGAFADNLIAPRC